MVGGQARAQSRELALKEAKWRNARNRKRRQKEQSSCPRQGVDHPRHFSKIGRTTVLLHIAGAEKYQRLRNRMEEHVEHRAKRTESAAKAQRRDRDTSLVDARIAKQPPKVPLHEHERSGHEDGRDAKDNQQPSGILLPEA